MNMVSIQSVKGNKVKRNSHSWPLGTLPYPLFVSAVITDNGFFQKYSMHIQEDSYTYYPTCPLDT